MASERVQNYVNKPCPEKEVNKIVKLKKVRLVMFKFLKILVKTFSNYGSLLLL